MKKGRFCNFSFGRDDVAKICFLSNRSFILGDHLFTYESPMSMMSDLQYLAFGFDTEEGRRLSDSLLGFSSVEKVNNIPDYPTGKSVEEMFDDALNQFLQNRTRYWGEIIKNVSDDEAAFMMEIYNMQDALYYAMEDLKGYKGILTEDDIFNQFLAEMGYWWVIDLCGLPRAIRMLKSFFAKYYPVIKPDGK